MTDLRMAEWPKKLCLAAAIVYWLALVVGMHIPEIPRPLEQVSDKSLHFAAYAVLTLLVAAAWSMFRPFHWPQAVGVAMLLMLNAVVDEVTQPLVGRTGDVRDWVADSLGILAALVAFFALRGALRRRPDSA